MHLCTLLLALCLSLCHGLPAAPQAHAPAAGAGAAETIGRAGAGLEPFLASGWILPDVPAERAGRTPQAPAGRPHTGSELPAGPLPARVLAVVRARPQSWVQIGPRIHHLGTPPPAPIS